MNINELILNLLNQFAGKSHLLDQIVVNIVNGVPLLMCGVIAMTYMIGLAKHRSDLRIHSVHATVSLIINLALASVVGHLFYEPRPLFAHTELNHPNAHVNDSSFPSDHATATLTLALGTFPISRILGWVFVGGSLIVCMGKIYLAEHYPLDILLTYGVVISMRIMYVKFLIKPVEKFYFFLESKILGRRVRDKIV